MVTNNNGQVYYPKITVIGIGGGGGSIVSEIAKKISKRKIPHLNKISFVLANVDFQAINQAPKQTKTFYFGKDFTKGLGCGMRPEIGEKAALKEKEKIAKLLAKNDICILVSSLGGGTGSGAAPVFAETAKEVGITSLGIFTKPFSFEGQERNKIASNSLRLLRDKLDAYTVMPNQRIFRIVDQQTPVQTSLSAMNEILVSILEGLIETLYLPGLINLDFSDFKAVISADKSLTYLNSVITRGSKRADKALEAILNNPLVNYNIKEAERLLFNVVGGKDLKMSEVAKISNKIGEFNPQSKIIFGIGQDNKYKNQVKITLMAVGCEKKKKIKKKKKRVVKSKKEEEKEGKKTEEKKKESKKIEKEKAVKKVVKKKRVMKKKKKPKERPEKTVTPSITKKDTVRRNALDLHKQAEEDMQKMMEEESKWDVPAFLRQEKN